MYIIWAPWFWKTCFSKCSVGRTLRWYLEVQHDMFAQGSTKSPAQCRAKLTHLGSQAWECFNVAETVTLLEKVCSRIPEREREKNVQEDSRPKIERRRDDTRIWQRIISADRRVAELLMTKRRLQLCWDTLRMRAEKDRRKRNVEFYRLRKTDYANSFRKWQLIWPRRD